MTLMKNKNLLYIFIEIVSMIGHLRDLVYTYEYRHGGLSCPYYFYCRESYPQSVNIAYILHLSCWKMFEICQIIKSIWMQSLNAAC